MSGEIGSGRTAIEASAVRRSPSAHYVRPADPDQVLEATLVIRRPSAVPEVGQLRSRDEIEKSLSADSADIAAVTDFARRYNLAVQEISPEKRMVRVEGRVDSFDRAFGIKLACFDQGNGTYLSYDGPLAVDSDIAGRITAALGLDQAPVAKHHSGTAE